MSNKRSLLLSMISTFFVLVSVCLALIRFYPYSSNFPVLPRITHTRAGADGDSVNLILIGTKAQILHSFHQVGWLIPNPITPPNLRENCGGESGAPQLPDGPGQ